jgi:branched-chain amino acid transport system substrate-binding protein
MRRRFNEALLVCGSAPSRRAPRDERGGGRPHAEVPDDPTKQVDVLLAAGTFADDLEMLRRLRGQPSALAAVGAGIGRFGAELGSRAEGAVGPSQWEEGIRFRADVGPRGADVIRSLRAAVMARLRAEGTGGHVDYPAAQAYAAGLVAVRCVEEAGTMQDAAVERLARGSSAPRSSVGSASERTAGSRTIRCWPSSGKTG